MLLVCFFCSREALIGSQKVLEKFTYRFRLYFSSVLFDQFSFSFSFLFVIIKALNDERKITLDLPYVFLSYEIMKTSDLKLYF